MHAASMSNSTEAPSTMPPDLMSHVDAIRKTAEFSRFFERQLNARPWLASQLETHLAGPLDSAAMATFVAGQGLDEASLPAVLRRLRAWVISHVMVRDLAGVASLTEVTETMTTLADFTVATACDLLHAKLARRYGEPLGSDGRTQRMIVIGMGKLGGRELNVSSDVDFIFVYPEDGETDGPKSISNFEFFASLGKKLIQSLNEITEEGQVFRVDMRLRPNGDSGPLVCSFDMLENYFITQGREWERYAWIKARAMLGERTDELASISRPFVFRKYLDFGAINAMRDLHAQIRREVARRDMANNVKLGPGGIREIEFIAQVFQLVRGGRDLALQVKPTLKVLELLPERGILDRATVTQLSAAYDFLRRLEHRLQYLDDAQTHSLPENEQDQMRIAAAMGHRDFDEMMGILDTHRTIVSANFEHVFGDPTEDAHALDGAWSDAGDQAGCADVLTKLGYADPDTASRRLAEIRRSARYQQMPAQHKARFDGIMPRALSIATSTPNPDQTLARILDLIEAISRRGAYLALLQQYPQALQRVAELVSASRWAATYLARHPILLDELLDARQLGQTPDLSEFRTELAAELERVEPDMERQMDVMRERLHTQVFGMLTQDIAGNLTVESLADHLSALADTIVELTIPMCWRRLRKRHRETPAFSVISYGKLGGKELGYSSDLDIVFLFDDPDPDAMELYSRLAQRINSWLSSQTAAGILYETDLRLRPNGDAGLLVTSVEAFRQYQLESAWTWEHQALTRARFTAGDRSIGERFEEIRIEVLRQARDASKLASEVIEMRRKMYENHGGKSDRFDLKQDKGGLIDVEFIVQYLVLRHAHEHAELCGNLGNIALLGIAARLGLIPAELAEGAAESYRSFRRHQHRLRLDTGSSRIEANAVEQERRVVIALWEAVFGVDR